MDGKLTVCLLNDSFPPNIDGVANAVVNYASVIDKKYGTAYVVVPKHPDAEDDYPFDVLRYKSFDVEAVKPYRVGYPLDSHPINELVNKQFDIIHTHCPIASCILARNLHKQTGVPLILTYHTKYDVDFHNVIKNKFLYDSAIKALLDNINACDDVWVVSKGAGENLRSIGYTGEYVVMRNGVDFEKGRASDEDVRLVKEKHKITSETLNLLFVGRLMWYKGFKIMLDALSMCIAHGVKARLIVVGTGPDSDAIQKYASELCLCDENCVFVGSVNDRKELKAYYCASDIFVFPSSFDTNGLVVSEAAASYVPSVVLKGSCAAEEVVDGENGFLCEENPASLFLILKSLYGRRDILKRVGEAAANTLYFSWEDAVAKAVERYKYVIEKGKNGELPIKKTSYGALISFVSAIQKSNRRVVKWCKSVANWVKRG